MPIAPRTYWAHVARPPSKRALWDVSITEILAGYYMPDERGRRPPESLYGSLKMDLLLFPWVAPLTSRRPS